MVGRFSWVVPGLLAAGMLLGVRAGAGEKEGGFVQMFDGKSLKGWKASEAVDSWKVEDGVIKCKGPRSHLFYMADPKPFKNFHWKAEVLTKPKGNSGLYFHTKFQETGWPRFGYEAQICNTHPDPRKTGSLYAVQDIKEMLVKDNEWFTEEVIVSGLNIIVKVNGKEVVNYTEPKDKKPGVEMTRKLEQGTFALQAHDPESEVHFKNLRVKRLPD